MTVLGSLFRIDITGWVPAAIAAFTLSQLFYLAGSVEFYRRLVAGLNGCAMFAACGLFVPYEPPATTG